MLMESYSIRASREQYMFIHLMNPSAVGRTLCGASSMTMEKVGIVMAVFMAGATKEELTRQFLDGGEDHERCHACAARLWTTAVGMRLLGLPSLSLIAERIVRPAERDVGLVRADDR